MTGSGCWPSTARYGPGCGQPRAATRCPRSSRRPRRSNRPSSRPTTGRWSSRSWPRSRQRSLIVLMTGLEPAAVREGLLPALEPLLRKHTVLLASVADPALTSLRTGRGDAARSMPLLRPSRHRPVATRSGRCCVVAGSRSSTSRRSRSPRSGGRLPRPQGAAGCSSVRGLPPTRMACVHISTDGGRWAACSARNASVSQEGSARSARAAQPAVGASCERRCSSTSPSSPACTARRPNTTM